MECICILDVQKSNLNANRSNAVVITVKNLLYSLVAHLSSSETLQRHDGRVGPVAQQQLAGLDVTSQRRSMKSCLTQRVHSVYLESEDVELILSC